MEQNNVYGGGGEGIVSRIGVLNEKHFLLKSEFEQFYLTGLHFKIMSFLTFFKIVVIIKSM